MEKITKAAPTLTKGKEVDLKRKSVTELKEMLDKQEKLLQNKNLIKLLPDRGKRIELLIEKIQKLLELRNSVDDAADRLNRIRLGDERVNYATGYEFAIKENSDVKMKMYPLKFKPNRLTKDKKATSLNAESPNVKSPSFNTQKSVPTSVEKKSCDSTDVPMLPPSTNNNSQPQTTNETDHGNETHRRLKNKYDASLEETFPYDKRHVHGAQLISIEEGMKLLKHHYASLQEAEMKRAESMLAANINTKMSTDISSWCGDKFNRYRDERGTSHAEENDDDDNDRDSENIDMKNSDDDDDYDGVD